MTQGLKTVQPIGLSTFFGLPIATRSSDSGGSVEEQLDFIQCPFPNQIQFGLEKLHPKIAYNFPNQFQFGLERKKLILQDADSKPISDWFGKIINYCQRLEPIAVLFCEISF